MKMNRAMRVFGVALLACRVVTGPAGAAWTVEDRENTELPGRAIEIAYDGTRLAEVIYGEGQAKVYLAVYDEQGQRLTNPGLSADGSERGRFPHHRGIFIGWNQIGSDRGTDDLWHLRSGERMDLLSIDRAEATDAGVRLELTIGWFSAKQDDALKGLLIEEQRTLLIQRVDGCTVIDQRSVLNAARDVRLGGDLQHAGLHFRADAAVDDVRGQAVYLWAPAELAPGGGRIVSDALRWVNYRFPLHGNWYAVTQLNRPENRTTELSWRDYGRFGFFFNDEIAQGASRVMYGRFLIQRLEDMDGVAESLRSFSEEAYEAYTR